MLSTIVAVVVATVITVPSVLIPLLATLIPVLTAVVARYRGSSKVAEALIAIVASGGLSVLSLVLDDTPGDTTTQLAVAFAVVLVTQLASYLTFWKPVVNINERLSKTGVI